MHAARALFDDVPNMGAALRQIELTYDETLRALGAALDLRDMETAGHSERVTRYSLLIARAMNSSQDELLQITRGAYLHDIGKIGIPDSILRKEGKLDPEEMDIMRTHVRIGYELVRRIAFLMPAAEIILSHHESYDGSGYPQGLRGRDIPRGARIFALADALDAITSDRPYRPAQPFNAAREEIAREAGKRFDPEAAEAFLSLPDHALRGTFLEERRRSTCLPLRTLVNCRAHAGEFLLTSYDLSETGISLMGLARVALGEEIDLEFALPPTTGKLRAKARVVRLDKPEWAAAHFVAVAAGDRQQIRRYIAEQVQA
jgi:putative nucleotidyltransferase with HDIG domain